MEQESTKEESAASLDEDEVSGCAYCCWLFLHLLSVTKIHEFMTFFASWQMKRRVRDITEYGSRNGAYFYFFCSCPFGCFYIMLPLCVILILPL
jgi:hypothetical protein